MINTQSHVFGDRRKRMSLPGHLRRHIQFHVLSTPVKCERPGCRRAGGWWVLYPDDSKSTLCAAHAADIWEGDRNAAAV